MAIVISVVLLGLGGLLLAGKQGLINGAYWGLLFGAMSGLSIGVSVRPAAQLLGGFRWPFCRLVGQARRTE